MFYTFPETLREITSILNRPIERKSFKFLGINFVKQKKSTNYLIQISSQCEKNKNKNDKWDKNTNILGWIGVNVMVLSKLHILFQTLPVEVQNKIWQREKKVLFQN